MLNLLLNLLMLLGVVVTVFLICIAFVVGLTLTAAIIGKVVELFKDDGKNNGGQ